MKNNNDTSREELKRQIIEKTILTGQKFMKTKILEDWTLSNDIMDLIDQHTEIQPEILYQVKYTDGAYRLFSTDNQNIDLLDMANINSKIVGNIYENPELLGTKSDIAVDIGFKEATNE